MTCVLDTSVVVRYLTNDPPDMGAAAAAVIEADQPLIITETALAEIAHVLRSVYGVGRSDVVGLLIDFVQRRNIAVNNLEKSLAVTALEFCRTSGRVSIPDALIWAAARSIPGEAAVYAFDRRFPADGIELRVPSA